MKPAIPLYLANSASWLSDAMSNLAIPWFVLQTTGSPAQTGMASLANSIGVYLSSSASGPLVDQRSGKHISIVSDALAGLFMLAIPLLYWADSLNLAILLLLIFFSAVAERPGFLSRFRSIPEIAEASGLSTDRASGLHEISYHSTLLVGPVLAGALMIRIGPEWILVGNGIGYAASILLVAFGIPAATMVSATSPKDDRTYWTRWREGITFLFTNKLLLTLIVTMSLGLLLVNTPIFGIILPVHMMEMQGSSLQLGLLVTAFAIGALFGAGLFTLIGERLPRRTMWLLCYGLIATPYIAVILHAPLPVLAGAMAVFGLTQGYATPLYSASRFHLVPAELRGRVFGALSPLTGLAPVIGSALTSFLIGGLGIQATTFILACGVSILWIWLVTNIPLKSL